MKYLKKFNEELKPQTYKNASRKLTKMGHTDRAKKLSDWADKREGDENLVRWGKNIEEFSKFGKFSIKVTNPETNESFVGDFYLDIIFDELGFIESVGDSDVGIWFHIGAIPVDESVMENCKRVMPEPDFYNGFYWIFAMGINYEIKDNKVELVKFYLDAYDDSLTGEVSLSDRGSAGKLRNLLIKMFSDSSFEYPSGYTDANTIYEVFERSILSESGFSSDYGFTLEEVANYMRTISPNTMYKS
jgi:hypothetical protein